MLAVDITSRWVVAGWMPMASCIRHRSLVIGLRSGCSELYNRVNVVAVVWVSCGWLGRLL